MDMADKLMVVIRKDCCPSTAERFGDSDRRSGASSDQHSQSYTAASSVMTIDRPQQATETGSIIQIVKQTMTDGCLSCRSPLQVVMASCVEGYVLSRQAQRIVSSADLSHC